MPDRYAVIGNPVAHSSSPLIHAEFARQTGQNLIYGAILAPLDGFGAAVKAFIADGGKGLNVTVPFKFEAYQLAQELTPRARAAEAVNTLKFDNGAVFGDNTDGVGLRRDIEDNLGVPIAGKRVLLMGAGGAAHGVVGQLLEAGPAALTIANRTLEKARELAAQCKRRRASAATGVAASGYAKLAGREFDLVINATSAGLSAAAPPLPAQVFGSGALAYDMVYGRQTPFLRLAAEQGARVADGTGMLVEQAAESFFVWRGVRPETKPVIDLLRRKDEG